VDATTIITWILIAAALAVALVALALVRRVRAELESRYRRSEAWMAIYAVLQPRAPLGRTGPWIASPELLHDLVLTIFETRPRRVVELGSGLSTLVCAYALQKVDPGGRIISLDHDEHFAEATRRQLRMHGLEEIVQVIHAPLRDTPTDLGTQPWYTVPEAAVREPIDLLIVDGPPGGGRRLARYPAFPVLRDRLSSRAVVVVDDARRPDEQEIVARWKQLEPELVVEQRLSEKGTALLRRVTRTSSPAR
jgi:predicted O-methyltransferase YrrM